MTKTTDLTLAAVDLMISLINRAAAVSSLVSTARAEGRQISADEWKAITDADDKARAAAGAAVGA